MPCKVHLLFLTLRGLQLRLSGSTGSTRGKRQQLALSPQDCRQGDLIGLIYLPKSGNTK